MGDRSEQPAGEPGADLDRVVDLVKHQIIFGRLRPRERLTEDELCAQFGVSRHLIRAAFVRLEHLGLVTRRPNRGATVRDFSVEEVEEIYDMRALLQAEAARRIPLPVPQSLLDRLYEIHAAYADAIRRQDLGLVSAVNDEFHRTVFAAAGNRYLAQMIERLWTETLGIHCYAIGDPTQVARSHAEHGLIIDALARGDRDELVRLVVAHMWLPLNIYKRAHGGWLAAPPPARATG